MSQMFQNHKILRTIIVHTGLFLAVILILWAALTAAAAIPNEAIAEHMTESAMVYGSSDAFAFGSDSRWNGIADNYADCILLGVTWNMGIGNPVTAALNTRYYDGGEEYGENGGLYLSVTEGLPANTDYTRYWHGMAALIRPLMLVMNVNGIKLTGFIVLLALIAVSIAILLQHRHWQIAIMLALSLILVDIWNVRLSMEYQPGFLVTFVLLPLWLILERKSDRYLTLLSVASGTMIAFFDFLTTETLTVLLPLILIVAVRARENRLGEWKHMLRLIILCGIAWGASYAAAYLVKWAAASIAIGGNAFALAFSGMAERIDGEINTTDKSVAKTIFSSITANFSILYTARSRVEYLSTYFYFGGSVLVLLSIWYMFRADTGKRTAALLLLMLGAVVPLRYLVLNNHSFLHGFFTYRALASTILATFLALWLNIRVGWKKTSKGGRAK